MQCLHLQIYLIVLQFSTCYLINTYIYCITNICQALFFKIYLCLYFGRYLCKSFHTQYCLIERLKILKSHLGVQYCDKPQGTRTTTAKNYIPQAPIHGDYRATTEIIEQPRSHNSAPLLHIELFFLVYLPSYNYIFNVRRFEAVVIKERGSSNSHKHDQVHSLFEGFEVKSQHKTFVIVVNH